MPSAPALAHANSLGLVYDFLTDSSASLSAELPVVEKEVKTVIGRPKVIKFCLGRLITVPNF